MKFDVDQKFDIFPEVFDRLTGSGSRPSGRLLVPAVAGSGPGSTPAMAITGSAAGLTSAVPETRNKPFKVSCARGAA